MAKQTIEQAIERAKIEILADVAAGTVPPTCVSFAELHDYVDANGYGGAFEDMPICADDDSNIAACHAHTDFWNEVQGAVDAWLKTGALNLRRVFKLESGDVDHPICDLCSSEPGAFRYPVKTFIAEGMSTDTYISQSVGDWAACLICHDLIQKNDRAELAARSLKLLLQKMPALEEFVDDCYGDLATLFDEFFDNRCGEPIPAVSPERTEHAAN